MYLDFLVGGEIVCCAYKPLLYLLLAAIHSAIASRKRSFVVLVV